MASGFRTSARHQLVLLGRLGRRLTINGSRCFKFALVHVNSGRVLPCGTSRVRRLGIERLNAIIVASKGRPIVLVGRAWGMSLVIVKEHALFRADAVRRRSDDLNHVRSGCALSNTKCLEIYSTA
jgi:hypothetical protein